MKKRKIKKLSIIFISIAGAGIIIFAFLFYKNIYIKKAPSFENRKFATILHTIEKGDNFVKVAEDLKQKDLISSKFWLETYFLLSGRWSRIKAGTYDLPYGLTTNQLAGIISRGEIKKETFTILEGWTLKDIAKYGEYKGFFTQAEFFQTAGNPVRGTFPWWVEAGSQPTTTQGENTSNFGVANFKKIAQDFAFLWMKNSTSSLATSSALALNLSAFDLEGYMFPDTYHVDYPITPEKVIRMALSNFQKKVGDYTTRENLKEIIIMASLLEKEVRSYEDKQIVAGILWKRIREGWPLQVDSTINYAKGEFGVKTYFSDLEFESLYNTYKYKGLPPGPICNPGLESIKAAIEYKETEYWYYLSAKSGKTIFSKTFNQHVAAKAKYLR